MRRYFENTSTGICRSAIPRVREFREAQLVYNFLYVATQFAPKNTRLRSSI